MRQNIKQKLLTLIITLFLFSGFVWVNTALAWTAIIFAEGEDHDLGEVIVNSVEIGVAQVAEPIPAPPFPPPQYSVKMDLYTSDLTTLMTLDIRKEGDIQHTWIIGVDPHGNVGSLFDPATTRLSWDSSQFGPGRYQLHEGYDGTGAIVVEDMRTTMSYNVEGLQFPPQFFTVIFTEIDSDEDDVPDRLDNCPNTFNPDQEDGDGDGAGNVCDNCPADPNKTDPGACGCGAPKTDLDSDGTPDCIDGCPEDPNKTELGTCGCGIADTDTDSDGTPDCNDGCSTDPNKTTADVCGCGIPDTDTDGDGTPDCHDNCPNDSGKTDPGTCGCGIADTDFDKDDIPDCIDLDDDNDTISDDTDTDDDNDGMPDEWEDQYGFNSIGDDALKDEDEDGFTNLQEYLAGTDPTNKDEKPEGTMAHWYVDGAVNESGDGRMWSTAFKTIHEAINNAEDGLSEIWVKQWDYVITSTIEVFEPVEIYAGFTGTEILRSQRDWQTKGTTIDGDNAVRCFSVSADAIIDGFMITNGNPDKEDENVGEGGGILNCDGSSPTISNCTFFANSAQATGGAIQNDTSNATITNCVFFNNQLTREQESGGGGICNYNSNPIITNCIFWGNHVDATQVSGGGAILNISSSPTITNCTIVGNSVAIDEDEGDEFISGGGGILNIEGSNPIITNCIISENMAFSGPEIYDVIDDPEYVDSNSTVTYSNVNGGYEGTGNITKDPLLADPENGDFHLKYGSPCINAGDPEVNHTPELPDVDFEGGLRILGGSVDIGADEAFVSTTGANIGIGVVSGGTMTSCIYIDPTILPDDPNKPEHFLYDRLIEMAIENVDSGLAVVRIFLPNLPPPPEGYDDWKWYKYTPADEWIDFSRDVISGGTGDGAEINGNVVTLYISDNGPYDKDPTDGIIQDPSGFGTIASTIQHPAPQPTSGGSGICFIATAAN